MKKNFLLLLALLATTPLWAYDFQVGDLFYNITSHSEPYTVEVTYEEYAYENYSLTNAIIPETVIYNDTTYNVTCIGDSAFFHHWYLTSITIPNSVTSIGENAFCLCHSLTSINIPDSVMYIGFEAFAGCHSLTSITIPNSVMDLGQYAFDGCSSLTSVTIGNSITRLSSTFQNCSALTSITIPETVTSIGSYAFKRCSSLTSVTIPNSVTYIGFDAFLECTSLTSVTIGNGIKTIGESAFKSCDALTSIKITATTPPTLESSVFTNCKLLSAIYIPDNTLSAYQQAWGTQYSFVNNETTLTLHVETPGTLEDLIYDAGMRPALVAKLILTGTLNDNDFTCIREKMTSLVDVDLSGITNTSGVILTNSKLAQVTLPIHLISIEDNAFRGCAYLASITIPNSVTSIGKDAFYKCSALPSITIPNSVTSIGARAFYRCLSLKSINLPNSIKSIESETFYYCYDLRSIIIPNGVTSIGAGAFDECWYLASVTIPNSVTSIGKDAFRNSWLLESITIPESVLSIGEGALNVTKLNSITCLGTTPPDASNLGPDVKTCILTVPHSAYNTYIGHDYWGQFLIINAGYWVTLQTNNDQWGEVTGSGLYTQEATITATPYEGYTFKCWSDGNTDNPRTIQVSSDITLTAEFDLDTRYLVTFVDWDGTVLSSVSVVSGEAAIAPADPSREGYTFIGWDKDFSNVTDNITVTAQYQINRYRVRFFDYDDTLLHTDSVEYQSAAVAPTDPYRAGYTFIGWDKEFNSITADLDIYAQYEMGEERDMTIVFTNGIDGNEIQSQSISIKLPQAPEIEGFTFLYWQTVAEPLSNVITIQAVYESNTPTDAPEVFVNPANKAQKLIRNGQVYILHKDKEYTISGQIVK